MAKPLKPISQIEPKIDTFVKLAESSKKTLAFSSFRFNGKIFKIYYYKFAKNLSIHTEKIAYSKNAWTWTKKQEFKDVEVTSLKFMIMNHVYEIFKNEYEQDTKEIIDA
jgi:hypothetical protein